MLSGRTGGLPLPPFELATRVGSLEGHPKPWDFYLAIGRWSRDDLIAALPSGFSFEGRRVLDFGCGAGRTLRHFVEDLPGEFWGCDIDASSVSWLEEELSPPVHPFLNAEDPPMDQPDEMFDLIYCVSVFTHLSKSWSSWMVELHRVLKPEGLLLATFLGEGEVDAIAQEEWNEDLIGMLTLHPGQSWESGGPMILHSPWWIHAHWGRLFDIVSLVPYGFPGNPGERGHGLVVMRKKELSLTPEDLEIPSNDPREAKALAHNVKHLMRELEVLTPAFEATKAELHALIEKADQP